LNTLYIAEILEEGKGRVKSFLSGHLYGITNVVGVTPRGYPKRKGRHRGLPLQNNKKTGEMISFLSFLLEIFIIDKLSAFCFLF
jgi:hypothetical protein